MSFEFGNNENINLLWEIITDSEEKVDRGEFIKFIKEFSEKQDGNQNLVEMNKEFLRIFMNKQKEVSFNFLKNNSTTYQDISMERKTKFEKELQEKQSEFSSIHSKHVPETPNFKDKIDTPISEMEKLIAETLAQRNFEIEQIQKTVNKESADTNWLSGTQTSIKKNENNEENVVVNGVKYIKIGEEVEKSAIIKEEPPTSHKKKISWADNLELKVEENTQTPSFFSKLKMSYISGALETKIDDLIKEQTTIKEKLDAIIDILSKN